MRPRLGFLRTDSFRILALCWVTYASAYVSRSNMAASLTQIVQENAFPISQVSMLGTLFFISYAVGQLINGRVGDIASPRVMIGVGLFLSAACNLLFGASHTYWISAVAWAVNGFALSALWGPIMRLMAHSFNQRRRNSISMLMMASSAVGCMVSWGFSDLVIDRMSYRALFTGTGAWMLLYGVAFLALIPKTNLKPAPAMRKIGGGLMLTGIVPIVLVCVVMGFIKEGINFYAPYMLERSSGGAISVSYVVVLPVFSLIGSVISAILNRREGIGPAKFVSTLFAACLVSLLTLFLFGLLKTSTAPLTLAMLGLSSAMMYAVTTYLLGFYPMRYDKMDSVSYIAGILDFFAYIGAGASSLTSGFLFDTFGLNSVIFVWMLLALLVTTASLAVRAHRRASGPGGTPAA